MKLPSQNPFIRLINEVLRVHGRTRAVFCGVESETGLPVMELSVLASVAEARTPPTVSELGRSLGHPRQVIQRAANELVAAGLLKAEDNPRHKRAKVLWTTAAGDQLKRKADARAELIAREVMAALAPESFEEAAKQLREVRMAMDRWIAAQADTRMKPK
jgi:DNA-binding MarR family transcriptional regulator